MDDKLHQLAHTLYVARQAANTDISPIVNHKRTEIVNALVLDITDWVMANFPGTSRGAFVAATHGQGTA